MLLISENVPGPSTNENILYPTEQSQRKADCCYDLPPLILLRSRGMIVDTATHGIASYGAAVLASGSFFLRLSAGEERNREGDRDLF
jgi:hypothetical protein